MPRLISLLTLSAVAMVGSAQPVPSGQREVTATSPPRTTHAVGFYDPIVRRVVLIGGAEQPRAADRDQVWSWSGKQWERITAAGPPARTNAAAAFDARRRIAIVAGGARRSADDSTFETIADTWQGRPTGWERLSGADFGARDHQAMAYDDDRGSVIMFGGIPADRSAPWPTDTWQLGDDGWRRIASEGPAARARAGLVYDSRRRQLVLFGGVGAAPGPRQPQPFFNDTWVSERTGWRQVSADGPTARYAHGIVFDESAGVVLVYSGAAAHRDAPLSDMWQWDGTRWTEIRLSGPTPGHRYQPVMVYDRNRGKTVLYGGIQAPSDDTWEWDGRQWREIRP